MKPPIFILGCPRSGTTLLASLLAPTEYGSPIETHFITKYYKRLHKYGSLQEEGNFCRLVKDISQERPVMQWKLSFDAKQLFREMDTVDYRKIVNAICRKMAEMRGLQSWGDKTPSYILDLNIIYQLFPNSKYVYIVRDGRDVALSLLEKPWGPNNVFSCAHYWKVCNASHVLFEQLDTEQRLYCLRYEDLLRNPDRIVSELYEFLGGSEKLGAVGQLLNRIKKDNSLKWKTAMSAYQVRLFEYVAADTLKRFGYETSYPQKGIGKGPETLWLLHDAIVRMRFLLKHNTVDTIKIKFFGKEPFAE